MFMRLSSQSAEQFALIAVAVTLEFFKIFSIVRGNTLWRLKLKSQATRAYTMYAILAIVAVMASYGFTLTIIHRNITIADSSTITLAITNSQATQKLYQASLKTMDASIAANQARLAALPPDFTSAAQSLNNTIAKLQAAEVDAQAKLSAEQTNELTLKGQALEATKLTTTTVSMFKLMSDGFKWLIPSLDENALMLFLLLVISLIIELGIISTSPAIPIDQRHLKHFLDEMSAHKAEELLAEVQGHKKKEQPRRQTIAGRIAQWWMNTKKDVNEVTHPVAPPPKIEIVSVPRAPKLVPTESTSIGSVPVRKRPLEHIEPSEPWPRPQPRLELEPFIAPAVDLPKTAEVQAVEEAVVTAKETARAADATFSEPEPRIHAGVPLRSTPAPTIRGPESPHEEPIRTSPVAPQLVAEAKIYRFGKTTEAVKDMFVGFVQKLFSESTEPDAPLRSVEEAAKAAGVPVALAGTFLKRLLEIRGSRGATLIEKRTDEKLYPNYPEGYIIAYATAEPSRERAK